jgi:hypothetical protein
MDDGAWAMTRECRIEMSGIEDITLLERTPADELGVPFRQIVECDWQQTLRGQRFASVTADEPGTAGHENGFHRAHGILAPTFSACQDHSRDKQTETLKRSLRDHCALDNVTRLIEKASSSKVVN